MVAGIFTVLYRLSGWGDFRGVTAIFYTKPARLMTLPIATALIPQGRSTNLTDSGTTWTYKPLHVLNGSSDGLVLDPVTMVADSQR